MPSGSDAVEHEVNPATPVGLTIDGFSLDDSGELSVEYTIGAGSAVPFTIGIYGSPDGVQAGELLQSYDAAGADLTVGDQEVTLNADFGELGAADSYLLAVLDTNDDVYVTSRANVSASFSLADYQAVFQNPDDENVYVFTGIGTGNTVAVTQDATTGNVTVTLKSVPATFSSVSNVYVYSLGSSAITIDPSVTAPVSVYGPESSVTGEVANWPDVALEADVPTAAESGGQPGEFTFYCPNDDATGNLTVYFLVSRTPRGATAP